LHSLAPFSLVKFDLLDRFDQRLTFCVSRPAAKCAGYWGAPSYTPVSTAGAASSAAPAQLSPVLTVLQAQLRLISQVSQLLRCLDVTRCFGWFFHVVRFRVS
jgi:hypothetical protein